MLIRSFVLVLLAAASMIPAGPPQEARWTASRGIRAGSEDGPSALADVFDIEIGPSGELLVAQSSLRTIAVFDSGGHYLRSIGGRGRGPGEFQILGRMGWVGDTLWVVDVGRLQLFTSELDFARVIMFPTLRPPPGIVRVIPGPILADRSILGIPMMPDADRPSPIVRLSSAGIITDTIAHVLTRDAFVQLSIPGVARAPKVANPWFANPLWMTDPGGTSVVIVDRPVPERAGSAVFTIVRIGLNGDTLAHREVEYVPVELGSGVVDRWYHSESDRIAGLVSVTPARAEQSVREAIRPPRYHAPVSGMVIGRDGTIWLRREDAGRPDVDWQVFDGSGHILGRVSLPSNFELHRARMDRVWGIEEDSLDIPYVRVYEIRRSNGGTRAAADIG